MRSEIIEELSLVDPKTLRLVHSMMRAHAIERELEEDPIVAHTITGEALRETTFFDGMDQSLEEAKKGASRSAEEVFKEKTEWLKEIK